MSTPSGEPSNNKPAVGESSGESSPPAGAGKGPGRNAILWVVAGLAVIAVVIGVMAAVGGDSDDQHDASRTSPTAPASPGGHGDGHGDGHGGQVDPSSTVVPPPLTTPGPPVDAKLAAAQPLSNVDAKTMIDRMGRDWGVGFGKTPPDQQAELTEQLSAIKTDEPTGLITRVTATWGKQDGKLRRLSCTAIDTKPENGPQIEQAGIDFLHDCALRGVEGAQKNALKAWMDANLTGDVVAADRTGKKPVNLQGTLGGGVRMEAVSNPGIAVSIYGPGA